MSALEKGTWDRPSLNAAAALLPVAVFFFIDNGRGGGGDFFPPSKPKTWAGVGNHASVMMMMPHPRVVSGGPYRLGPRPNTAPASL